MHLVEKIYGWLTHYLAVMPPEGQIIPAFAGLKTFST